MTEVTDIADDYESASEALQSLAQCSDEAIDILQPINSQSDGLGEVLEAASEALKELLQETEQIGSRTADLAGDIGEIVSPLNGAASEADGSVSQFLTSIAEAGSGFVAEVEAAFGEATSSHVESLSLVDVAQGTVNLVFEAMEAADSRMEGVLEKLSASVQESHGKIDTAGNQATEGFDAIIQAIQGEMGPGTETVMEQLSQLASGDFVNLAESGIDQLKGTAESLFGNFDEVTKGLGEKLEQRATQILSDLADHAADSAASKVSDSVEDIISVAVTKLSSEIAEAIALTTIGSSTTAMLAPILPQLAAAKAIVGTIERALALLDAIF